MEARTNANWVERGNAIMPLMDDKTKINDGSKEIVEPKPKPKPPATDPFTLFCKCTSVRGMGKLPSGPIFLRIIWLLFVISMTCLLLVSVALLVKDFLNYDVNVFAKLRLDDPTPFPAITVCHQPPYSPEAYRLWNRSEILSPSEYNRYMRKLVLNALRQNDITTATMTWGYDSQSVYYQNLSPQDAVRLGHKPDVFLACMKSSQKTLLFEDNCGQIPGYRMRQFSHHMYMNCYTFEPGSQKEANETNLFSLIVSMGPDRVQKAFFSDVFEQARGLRVVIHEAGTLPNLDTDGVHVEPGKLNEITYEVHRWTKQNTPKRSCIRPDQLNRFRDLEDLYNYTHTDCLLVHQQADIIKNCRCIYVLNPRLRSPHSKLPYCGNIYPNYNGTEFIDRLVCLSRYLSTEARQKYDGRPCLPRCNYYTYKSSTSITKWTGQPWQLYWLRVQNQASNTLLKEHEQWPEKDLREHSALKQWEVYLTYENLSHIPGHEELRGLLGQSPALEEMTEWPPRDLKLDSDTFTYVVVKRKSGNTIEQNEKLMITSYVLVSRIGGLCSLTIGLTAAFVVELVEFSYHLYQLRRG